VYFVDFSKCVPKCKFWLVLCAYVYKCSVFVRSIQCLNKVSTFLISIASRIHSFWNWLPPAGVGGWGLRGFGIPTVVVLVKYTAYCLTWHGDTWPFLTLQQQTSDSTHVIYIESCICRQDWKNTLCVLFSLAQKSFFLKKQPPRMYCIDSGTHIVLPSGWESPPKITVKKPFLPFWCSYACPILHSLVPCFVYFFLHFLCLYFIFYFPFVFVFLFLAASFFSRLLCIFYWICHIYY
jgi:hypothetical protein